MGRASRWFKSLIGSKSSSDSPPAKDKKKKWAFAARSSNTEPANSYEADANRHAIAVAAATAAVAEAALAAAQAAAEVVRLTSGGSRPGTASEGSRRRREWAAVQIQSTFRAYLARRALRALKGLVRLQALVRGHIVRRQSADMLRRMQALARIQARVCANRAHVSESSHSSSKSSQTRNPGLATPKKQDKKLRDYSFKSDRSPTQKNGQSRVKSKGSVDLETALKGSNWLNRWMEECSWNNQGATSLKTIRPDDERSDKILEVDTCYPHLNFTNRTEKFRSSSHHVTSYNYGSRKQNPSISSGENLSLSSIKYPNQVDDSSPQVYSASSRPGSSSGRKGPFTPARSECSRSFFNGYSGYPNYMANTESYRQKVRSQSAPRQRSPFERIGSTTRFYNGYCDSDIISENGSALQDEFRNKAYSGSGRTDRARVSSARQI